MRKQIPENLIGDSWEAFLRRSIIAAGFTLKGFAIRAGISPSSLGTILKRGVGTTSVDTAIQICDALGISLETLARYPQNSATQETIG